MLNQVNDPNTLRPPYTKWGVDGNLVREDANYVALRLPSFREIPILLKNRSSIVLRAPEQLAVATMSEEVEVYPECTFVCAPTAIVLTAGWVCSEEIFDEAVWVHDITGGPERAVYEMIVDYSVAEAVSIPSRCRR